MKNIELLSLSGRFWWTEVCLMKEFCISHSEEAVQRMIRSKMEEKSEDERDGSLPDEQTPYIPVFPPPPINNNNLLIY